MKSVDEERAQLHTLLSMAALRAYLGIAAEEMERKQKAIANRGAGK